MKPLPFSGYDWNVGTIAGDRGGTNNLYDGDNAWVDGDGAMHLRSKKKGDRWACAEVELARTWDLMTQGGFRPGACPDCCADKTKGTADARRKPKAAEHQLMVKGMACGH